MSIDERCQEIMNGLSVKLKKWRRENKLSKRRLAKITGLSESTIRNIESGHPNPEIISLVKIRIAYNVRLLDLFNEDVAIPKVREESAGLTVMDKSIEKEKKNIGKRLKDLQMQRGLNAEALSLLSYNVDYSDTLKYQRGEKNIELRTLIKYAGGLEVGIIDIFNYNGPLPSTRFIGKMK